jgi:PadR family transcriptional regulator, regulatory protein PadR
MAQDDLGLLHGTLDLLVLRVLAWDPQHGYGIARWIKQGSGDALIVEDRALYLALHRLEERGWIDADWGLSENNRRAKYYRLTSAGRRQLQAKIKHWREYVDAVSALIVRDMPAVT